MNESSVSVAVPPETLSERPPVRAVFEIRRTEGELAVQFVVRPSSNNQLFTSVLGGTVVAVVVVVDVVVVVVVVVGPGIVVVVVTGWVVVVVGAVVVVVVVGPPTSVQTWPFKRNVAGTALPVE